MRFPLERALLTDEGAGHHGETHAGGQVLGDDVVEETHAEPEPDHPT